MQLLNKLKKPFIIVGGGGGSEFVGIWAIGSFLINIIVPFLLSQKQSGLSQTQLGADDCEYWSRAISVVLGMAFWVLICIIWWIKETKERKLKAELNAATAKAFDYKVFAPISSKSFATLKDSLQMKDGVNNEERIDLDEMTHGEVKFVAKNRKGYVPISDLLSSDVSWNKDFQSLPVREGDKYGKCIIQVSFIPVDKDGRMPLILRLPNAHSRECNLHEVQGGNFTFISFSPVPRRFGMPFNVADCYHREVPERVRVDCFDEYGCVIKCEEKTQVEEQAKSGENADVRRFYVFYIFLARYKHLSFAKTTGEMNEVVIKKVFASDEASAEGTVRYFTKDHDQIVCVAKIKDVKTVFCGRDKGTLPEPLRTVLNNKQYRYSDGKNIYVFDLALSNLGKVEREIIQRLD